jgi:hypothetical protein
MMEKNAKTILLAVFILLIAIVSFNFTGMTGEAVKDKDVLKITSHPNGIVHKGEVIRVKVTPTKEGVDNRYMYIYTSTGIRKISSKAWVCGRWGNACYKPSEVIYNALGTDAWAEGDYFIRAKNHKTGKNIDVQFRLVE